MNKPTTIEGLEAALTRLKGFAEPADVSDATNLAESEAGENVCDENGDGDRAEAELHGAVSVDVGGAHLRFPAMINSAGLAACLAGTAYASWRRS